MPGPQRKISFPADSVLNAVIQDGDTQELIKILTSKSEIVNINLPNHVGITALHHAVLSNNLDAVKLLLSYGANVNAQDVHGFSPLHTASACGSLQISSLLLLFGADVFSQTKQSELPVDVAKDISVIRLLTKEMYNHIHSELYVHSLVTTKLLQLWKVLYFIGQYIYTFLYNRIYKNNNNTRKEKQINSNSGTTYVENYRKHKRKDKPSKVD